MGFSTLLDIIGSMIIGGILLSITMRLNDAATEKTYNNSGELSMQQNLAVVAQILEKDFRKIGYCADWNNFPDPSKAIVFADSSRIIYLTDIDSDSDMDSINYYLGPASELSSTPNPRDRLLYRVLNNETPLASNMGVTQFRLVYFDALGDTIPPPITTPGAITSIENNITAENVAASSFTAVSCFGSGLVRANDTMSFGFVAVLATPTAIPAVLMSVVVKKSFCSWMCPVGTISESLWKLGQKLFGRTLGANRWIDYPLRSLSTFCCSSSWCRSWRWTPDRSGSSSTAPTTRWRT